MHDSDRDAVNGAVNNATNGGADIRREGGAGHGADSTQTFGHDSDLSFIPFGSELTEAEVAAINALPARAALLLVRSGPTAGARYLLDTDVTTVGRHPEADIFFDDVTVSRRHAEITRTGGFFELIDQRSLNGSYVNGERVDRAVLDDGAEVRIGKFRLNFFVSPLDRTGVAGG
ncbi:MAG: FHA domain-containing protein [Microbacterium sp.]